MSVDLYDLGERRHEQCRFGVFADEAYSVDEATGTETPIVMPLCAWEPLGPAPPAIARLWGGAIDFDRDCAVCTCYCEIKVETPAL